MRAATAQRDDMVELTRVSDGSTVEAGPTATFLLHVPDDETRLDSLVRTHPHATAMSSIAVAQVLLCSHLCSKLLDGETNTSSVDGSLAFTELRRTQLEVTLARDASGAGHERSAVRAHGNARPVHVLAVPRLRHGDGTATSETLLVLALLVEPLAGTARDPARRRRDVPIGGQVQPMEAPTTEHASGQSTRRRPPATRPVG